MLVDDKDYFEFRNLFADALYYIGGMSERQEYQIYGFVKALIRDDSCQSMMLENISEKIHSPGRYVVEFLTTSFEKYNTDKCYSDDERKEFKTQMKIICQEILNMITDW